MTNEQEKARELAKLLTAFADGKRLQFLNDDGYWCNYAAIIKDIAEEFLTIEGIQIRIKPETKRIALTRQDLIDRELSNKTTSLLYGGTVYHISKYDQDGIYFAGGNMFSYEYIKENDYDFIDNSPCCKEVECE